MGAIADFLFGWIIDLLYEGVIYICMLVISATKGILTLISDIANITFFADSTINGLKSRVYIIIGVLMLFKITISCIQYLVNPEKAEDKENGFGGIIKRTIFSVLLLAFVPTIFTFAKTAQNALLDALPKVILNQKEKVDNEALGESIAYTTTLAFFGYSSDGCNDGSIKGLPKGDSRSEFKSTDDIIDNAHTIATDESCGGEKRYSFNWLLCLPTGIYLVFILISMTIDVGIRVIKFGFLEIIAPIPIASYIDPKTSKKSFDSWVHNCVSVYADLFIRLGVIYLVLYLFTILLPSFQSEFVLNDGTELSWGRSMLVNVAIIISLFMFAKNAPKFICDVLGIKDSGSLTDMFKRLKNPTPLAALANPFRNAAANAAYSLKTLKNSRGKGDKGEALRRALGGFAAGARDSASALIGGKSVEDLKKMRRASMAKSQKRVNKVGVRTQSRKEHNEMGKAIEKMKNNLVNMKNDLANRVLDIDGSLTQNAEQEYQMQLNGKRRQLATLKSNLQNENDPVAAASLSQQINSLTSEIGQMESAAGKQRFINENILTQKYDKDVAAKQQRLSDLSQKIANNSFNSLTEKQAAVEEYSRLSDEVNNLTTNRDANLVEIKSQYNGLQSEIETYAADIVKREKAYEKDKYMQGLRPVDTFTAFVNEELGISGIKGNAYTQVADIMKNTRSELWSGEAMTKLSQMPYILEESGHNEKFTTSLLKGKEFSYSEIYDLKTKVDNGTLQSSDLVSSGFASVSDIKAAFTEIEKKAATIYVTLAAEGTLKGGNSTITEALKRVRVQIENADISSVEKNELLKDFDKNPGEFLKVASDKQQTLRTKGARISAYNSGDKSDK